MIHVIATIALKPECYTDFVSTLKNNISNVRAEDGCVEYTPCVDVDSGLPPQGGVREHVVTIVEAWESLDHLRAHLKTPHMVDFSQKTKEMRTSTKLQVVEAL